MVADLRSSKAEVLISGKALIKLHSLFVSTAFIGSLLIGCNLYYLNIVKNEHFSYPDEWFPSISSTIGDYWQGRTFHQIFMCLSAIPRVLLMFISYFQHEKRFLNDFALFISIIRLFSAGSWIFITSSDNHPLHEKGMIIYLFTTVLYHACLLSLNRTREKQHISTFFTKSFLYGFAVLFSFMIYWFVQHKVYLIPGDFMVWTIYTGFFTVLWYFPLWALGFTGAELTALLIVFPAVIFRYKSWIWNFFIVTTKDENGNEAYFRNHTTRMLANGLSITLGLVLGSSHLLSQAWRLVLVSAGSGLALAELFLSWMGIWNQEDRSTAASDAAYKNLLGLLISSVVRIAFHSNNPAWPIMNSDNGGLVWLFSLLGYLGLLLQYFHDNKEQKLILSNQLNYKNLIVHDSSIPFAIGALLFAFKTFFTESSIVSRWATNGYPNQGLSPVLGGSLAILSILTGTFLSNSGVTIKNKPFVVSRLWWSFGSLSSLLFLFGSNVSTNAGTLGGLLWLFYLGSISQPLIVLFSMQPIKIASRNVFVAIIFASMLFMCHLYSVAYAFVPGGPLLRERTWVAFLALIITFRIPLNSISKLKSFKHHANSIKKNYDENIPFAPIAVPSIDEEFGQKKLKDTPKSKNSMKKFTNTLFVFSSLLFLAIKIRQMKSEPVMTYPRSNKDLSFYKNENVPSSIVKNLTETLDNLPIVSAGIWTIHFGLDNEMYSNHQNIINIVKKLKLDFLGLLESDLMRVVTGNRDLPAMIGESLGMYVDYGPSPRLHTWGCSLLSKYPIMHSKHYLLPSPVGELACAILATVDVDGKQFDLFVSHNGQEEDALDRFLQTSEISKIINSRPQRNPIVFLGYVVTKPKEGNYFLLMKKGQQVFSDENDSNEIQNDPKGSVYDIDSDDEDRWCQYVGYSGPGLSRVAYARISRGDVTDTELQVAKFAITPKDAQKSKLILDIKQFLNSQSVAAFQKLPSYWQQWKFPSELYEENGWHSHYFHHYKHFWQQSTNDEDVKIDKNQ